MSGYQGGIGGMRGLGGIQPVEVRPRSFAAGAPQPRVQEANQQNSMGQTGQNALNAYQKMQQFKPEGQQQGGDSWFRQVSDWLQNSPTMTGNSGVGPPSTVTQEPLPDLPAAPQAPAATPVEPMGAIEAPAASGSGAVPIAGLGGEAAAPALIAPEAGLGASGAAATAVPIAATAAADTAAVAGGAAALDAAAAAGATAAASSTAAEVIGLLALLAAKDGGRIGYAAGGLLGGAGSEGGVTTIRRGVPKFRAGGHGLVHGAGAGRADTVRTSSRRGSYVIPADVVSGAGEGNTAAGALSISSRLPRVAMGGFAQGGLAGADDVPVAFSGGEYVIAPEQVAALGGGDLAAGARRLDGFVAAVREASRAALDRMPAPR